MVICCWFDEENQWRIVMGPGGNEEKGKEDRKPKACSLGLCLWRLGQILWLNRCYGFKIV